MRRHEKEPYKYAAHMGVEYYPAATLEVGARDLAYHTVLRREFEGVWYDTMITKKFVDDITREEAVQKLHEEVYLLINFGKIDLSLIHQGGFVAFPESYIQVTEKERLKRVHPYLVEV